MSFRELTMIEVREVIRQWQAGYGLRETARATGLDRKTVRRYVEALRALGVTRDAVPDDALVHQVASRVQTRAVPEPSVERERLMAHRERIEGWLTQKKPLRLTKGMRCTRTVARGGLRRAMVPGAVRQGCGAGGIVSQPTSASISAASSLARVAGQFFGASSR